jgi:predicted dehydrogenase
VQTTETHLRPTLTGFRLYGDAGVVVGRDDAFDVFAGDPRVGDQPTTFQYPEQRLSAYALELAAFADTVAGREIGPTTGYSERRSLAITEAGYESARTRRPVDLRERFPGIWA